MSDKETALETDRYKHVACPSCDGTEPGRRQWIVQLERIEISEGYYSTTQVANGVCVKKDEKVRVIEYDAYLKQGSELAKCNDAFRVAQNTVREYEQREHLLKKEIEMLGDLVTSAKPIMRLIMDPSGLNAKGEADYWMRKALGLK